MRQIENDYLFQQIFEQPLNMKLMSANWATLRTVTLLFVTCIVSINAKATCFNDIIGFKIDKRGMRYELGRDTLQPVSHSDTYECRNLDAISSQPSYPGVTRCNEIVLSSMMNPTLGYFAQLEKKGCSGSDGRDYCCDAGLKSFNVTDAYICEKPITENTKGGSTGKFKIAVTVEYSCNQDARRKNVALRFNADYKTACVTPP